MVYVLGYLVFTIPVYKVFNAVNIREIFIKYLACVAYPVILTFFSVIESRLPEFRG
jgi:hypothetical protein